jgi:3-oxoadipate enol-lactonase
MNQPVAHRVRFQILREERWIVFVDVGGTRIWVERTGKGPSIVLIHGRSDTHELWHHQVPVLRDEFDTISVDMPGHGASESIADPYTVERVARVIWGLLDRLDVDQPILCGLSMGGGVVQVMTLEAPDRVRALVLVSTSSEFSAATRDKFLRHAAAAERKGIADVADRTRNWFSATFIADHPDVVDAARQRALANDPRTFAAALRANAERGWSTRLSEIRCPVLFVGGLEDPADAVTSAERYRASLPDVETRLIEGVSHLLPIESPQRFNELLVDFLHRRA